MQRALFQSLAGSVRGATSSTAASVPRAVRVSPFLAHQQRLQLKPAASTLLQRSRRSIHSTQSLLNTVKDTDKKAEESNAAKEPPQPASTAAKNVPEGKDGRSTSLFDIDTSTSALIEAAEEPAEDGGKGGAPDKTGAKGKAKSMSSIERSRRNRTRFLLALVFVGLGVSAANLGRELDEDEKRRFQDSDFKDTIFGRMRLRLSSMTEDLNAPVWEKLLPDPLPFPYSRPYTLVVDLDDMMVHSSWSREKGWRTAKRPGLDYFLGYLSQWYEIVLYTSQPFYTAAPIIEKLDPDRRFLTYLLFRESCRNVNSKIVKDLDALNRDLSKVIIMDINPDGFTLHPQNAILVNKWEGNPDDRELISYIPFLEAIGIYNIPDVRKTLDAYKGNHIPTEHARRQAEIRAAEYGEWEKKQAKAASSIASGFRGMLGGRAGDNAAASSAGKGGFSTWYDLERKRFQDAYLEDEKYWKENGDAIRKQAKEDQERQLKDMKMNAWSFLTASQPKPPSQDDAAK